MGLVTKRSLKFALIAVALVAIAFIGFTAFASDDSDAKTPGIIYDSARQNNVGSYNIFDDSGVTTLRMDIGSSAYATIGAVSLEEVTASEAASIERVVVYGFYENLLTGTSGIIDSSYTQHPQMYYRGDYGSNNGKWQYDMGTTDNPKSILTLTAEPGVTAMQVHSAGGSPFYPYFFKEGVDVNIVGYQSGGDYLLYGFNVVNFVADSYTAANSLLLYDSKADSVTFGALTSITDGVPFGSLMKGYLKEVHLANVTDVGAGTFNGFSLLEEADIPNVATVGNNAFKGCVALTDAPFSQLTNVGANAFDGCTALVSVEFGSDASIANNAFNGCTSLTTISAENIATIQYNAFKNCSSLVGSSLNPTSLVFTRLTAISTSSGAAEQASLSPFYGCTSIRNVELPAIATMGAYSFYGTASGCLNLETLSIGGSLTTIPKEAFRGCTSLNSVTFTGNPTTIDEGVFRGCVALTSVSLPNTVTTLGLYAFASTGLTSVNTNAVTEMKAYCFNGCTALTTLTLGSSTQIIGNNAFSGCTNLTGNAGNITFPASLVSIGNSAFVGTKLGSVSFADGTTGTSSIGESAFSGCSTITSLDLGNRVGSIGNGAFNGCANIANAITIPASVTTIGDNAFNSCKKITGLTIASGSNLTTIGDSAFYTCSALAGTVTFPASLTSIGTSAFDATDSNQYVKITSVTFTQGSSDLSIGDKAFRYCRNIAGTVTFPGNTAYIGESAFSGCSSITELAFGSTVNDTQLTIGQSAFNNLSSIVHPIAFPSGLLSIGQSAFYRCTGITGLSFQATGILTTIGNNAFNGCSGITGTLSLPDTVKTIGTSAFNGTSITGTLVLPRDLVSIETSPGNYIIPIGNQSFYGTKISAIDFSHCTALDAIGQSAFYNCSLLRGTLTFPSTLKTIGNSAFYGSNSDNAPKFTDVVFNSGLTEIGNNAFQYTLVSGTYTGGTLTLPNTVTRIGDSAFASCSGITALNLGTGLITIGASAFSNDSNIAGVITLPSSLAELGNSAFNNCSGITGIGGANTVDLSGTALTTIGNSAFNGCSGLSGPLSLPSTLVTIGQNAFQNCSTLTSINFNGNTVLTTINNNAFYGCSGIAGPLVLPESLATLGTSAFNGCSSITSVSFGNNTVLQAISNTVFSGCSGITGPVVLPVNLKTIGSAAFEGTNVSSFDIGSAVTTVGNRSLLSYSLETITISASNPSYTVSDNILYTKSMDTVVHCPALRSGETVTIASTVQYIGEYAFYKTQNMTTVVFESANLTIRQNAFAESSLSGTLTLPTGIYRINQRAFYDCEGLTEVIIQSAQADLFSDGKEAFYGCPNITSLTIPMSVKLVIPTSGSNFNLIFPTGSPISSYTFTGVQSDLPSDYYQTNYARMPWYFTNVATGPAISVAFVGTQRVDAYMFNAAGCIDSVDLGDDMISFGERAFYNCTNMRALVLSPTMGTINPTSLIFSGCNRIENLTIPIDKDVRLGVVFNGSLRVLNLTKGTSGVGYDYTSSQSGDLPWANSTNYAVNFLDNEISVIGAYMQLSASGNVTIPVSVTTVKEYAFNGSPMTGLTLQGVTTLGDRAFGNCTSLVTLTLPNSLETVTGSPFYGCSSLNTVYLPITLNYSGSMFANCLALRNFTFTPGLNGIGYNYTTGNYNQTPWYALSQELTNFNVTFETGVRKIGTYMFYDCIGFSTEYGYRGLNGDIEFPSTVNEVGAHAFYNCLNVNSLSITGSNVTLGDGAFENCRGIRTLTYPLSSDSVVNTTAPVFANCDGITSIAFVGTGQGFNYDTDTYKLTPWYYSRGNALTITIGDGISSIGTNTFRGCTRLSGTIDLGDNITAIGAHAFEGDSNISTLILEAQSITIGESAFKGCAGITALTIDISINAVGYTATPIFEGCTGLSALTLLGGGNGNGYDYSEAEAVLTPWYMTLNDFTAVFDTGVKKVGTNMFSGCTGLAEAINSPSIRIVGDNAFKGCTGLSGFTAPAMITSGISAFEGCTYLSTFTAPQLATVTENMFLNCTNLTEATLTACTRVDDHAFENSGIRNVNSASGVSLPDVVYVGNYAFARSKVVTVTLGQESSSYTFFGDNVFLECPNLTEVNINGTLATLPYNTFRTATTSTSFNSQLRTVRANKVGTFAAHMENFRNLTDVHITSVTSFAADTPGAQGQFMNCEALNTVEVSPYSVLLPHSAFRGCVQLTGWDSVSGTGIDLTNLRLEKGYEFYGCTSLDDITISPAGLGASIPEYAFYGCSSLKKISAPAIADIGQYAFANTGITSICSEAADTANFTGATVLREGVFSGCTSLTSVSLANTTTVYPSVFSGCTVLASVEMPHVTSISQSMFNNCSNLSSVTAPLALTVAEKACYNCSNLVTISLPAVTRVGNITYAADDAADYITYAVFYGCPRLESVTMPAIQSVGAFAFYNCSALTSFNGTNELNLNGVTYVGFQAFAGTSSASVTVGSAGSSFIGDYAFSGCSSLKSFIVNGGLSFIGPNTLNGCQLIDSLVIPISANWISSYRLPNLDSIQFTVGSSSSGYNYTEENHNTTLWSASSNYSVTFASGIASIGDWMCLSAAGSVEIPATVKAIGTKAFYEAPLTSVSMSGVQTLGDEAFGGCTALTSAVLPDSLTSFAGSPFNGCTSLASVTLPITFGFVGNMFSGCTALNTFAFSKGSNGTGYAYTGDSYTSTPWYNTSSNITVSFLDGVVSIGDNMFRGCTRLNGTVSLPSTVTSIGEHAFDGDSNISALAFAANTLNMGLSAFKDCSGITSLTIPIRVNAVRSATYPVFEGCTGLRTLVLTGNGAGVNYSESGDSDYTLTPWYQSRSNPTIDVTIGAGISSIGNYMFKDCSALNGRITAEGITSIGAYAFAGCTSITVLEAPLLTSLGAHAFDGDTTLSEVIAANITTIPEYAFYGCTMFTTSNAVSVTSIGQYAFARSGIKNMTFSGSGVDISTATLVGNYAFAWSAVESITIGSTGVNLDMGDYVLFECPYLLEVTIDGKLPTLMANTFRSESTTNFTSPLRFITANDTMTFAAMLKDYFPALREVHVRGATSFNAQSSASNGMFMNCTALTTVEFYDVADNRPITIPKSAFEGCISLTTVNLDHIYVDNGREFYGCSLLNNVNLAIATKISKETFYGCSSLSTVSAPNATNIGEKAFQNSGVTSITSAMFSKVTKVEDYAFAGCLSLTTFTVSTITTMGQHVFNGCSALVTVALDNLGELNTGVFYGCNNLATVTLPKVSRVGILAFYGCMALITIELPMASEIGDISDATYPMSYYSDLSVFYNCTSLTTVSMPQVTAIGAFAFYRCSNLTSFNATGTDEGLFLTDVSTIRFAAFSETGFENVVVGKVNGTLTRISDYAFYGCSRMQTFSSPSLTELPIHLFNTEDIAADTLVPSLVSISVPKVTTFNSNLHGCTYLTTVDASSARMFCNDTFNGCRELVTVTLPATGDNVTLSARMFSGCEKLATINTECVIFSNGLDTPVETFKGCRALVSMTLPRAPAIPGSAFQGCTRLGSITAPQVTAVGTNAFSACTSLTSVSIPMAETIKAGAFQGCTALATINPDEDIPYLNVAFIEDDAFNGCAITSLTLGPNLKSIGARSFAYNPLRNLIIPNSDTNLNLRAGVFQGCPLVTVHISSSVIKIYANAFDISSAATTHTSFWFNGTITDTLFNVNGIVASTGQTLDIHADRESVARIPTLISGGYIAADGTVNAIQENAATVAIWNQEGATPVYSSVRAVYGGMVVMPFIRYNDGRLASCPFALYDSSKYIALYASEADYENSKVATTGVAVPMYPIKNESDDNLILVGRTTGGFESTFTVVTNSYDLDVDIVEQTVHYGSLLTIPTFTDPSVQLMALNLYRVNDMKYEMDVGTVSVYVGYCFATIEMMPEDVTIPVTFIYLGRGTGDVPVEKSIVAQVKIQSPFAVPSSDPDIVDDIVYPAGYSFEGWYTGRDGTGEKATSETRFSGGQHWYAWYKPIEYTIAIVSDSPAYQSEFTAYGPYVLRITNNSLYYDNNGTTNILMFEARSVTGYSVQSYTDAATGFPITTGETVTDNMTIDLYLQMNMYTLNLEFVDVTGGTSTPIPSSVAFTIDGWTVGTGSTYHSGDSVTDVPFSSLEGAGLLMPQPLHDSYAFSRMLAGSTPLTFSNGYHLTYDKFGDSLSVTIKYEMQTGKYTIRYNMNDDTSAVMTSSNSISVGESFLMPSIGRYAKTGYIYDHIEVRGLPEHYAERDNVTLTDEMVAHATYCVVDVDVMWIKIPYRIDFDLNGYAGDVPASLVNMNVDDVVTLPTAQISGNSGYRIASWHWVLGTEKSETFTQDPTMTKAVIDQFSTVDRVLTLQVDWIEKTYTLKVLPNPDDPMDPAAGYIFNDITATFGDFFTFWNNTYARAYMRFVGWQIGTEVYDNASTVRLSASMAAVGDASGNDIISVYMAWNKNEYQVQYNLDGGEGQIPSDDNAYIVNESDFTLAADTGIFYREGYSFQGWKYSKDAVIIYNNLSGKFEPILAANSTNNIVTFYAVWEQKTYKITYDLDMGTAGSFAPSKVFYGDEITISKPTRPGYEFAGWTAEGLTGGALYHSSSGYRSWDGVKTVTTEKFMDLCNIDYETDPEHGTIKMIAHWEQASYTITYDLNGGTGIPAGSQSQISIGERIILPTLRNPDRTGYEYVGWGVDPYNAIPNNTVFTESMAPKSENVLTLYVIWSPVEYKLNYRYTADYDYSTLVVDYDETARVPVLDRPGYTFKGWSVTGANPDTAYYSKDGSAWYRVASAVVDGTYFRNMTATKDGTVTLEGVWEEKSYRLVYNPNGGTGKAPVDSNIYVIGDAIVMQDYNVLAGTNGSKSVVGWSLESSGSSVTVTEFTPGLSEHADATGAVNFYAVWVDGMCTVSVNLEGADASSIPAGWTLNGLSGTYDKLVPYGSSTKDVMADWDNVNISKSGKNFTGWSYSSATITSTVNVTPDFETVNMSVMYIFGGVVGAVAVGMVALVRFKL